MNATRTLSSWQDHRRLYAKRDMDRLWAPWRSGYIAGTRRPAAGCIFCQAKRSRDDRRVYVIERGEHAFVLLNSFPYNAGHLMISPMRHVGQLTALSRDEASELFLTTQAMVARLSQALHPQGFNVGMNIGRPAGAGIPGHLHMHVVPRWTGDANFMPVIGKTKVVSQSLDVLYNVLRETA